jgi:CcmD family protein
MWTIARLVCLVGLCLAAVPGELFGQEPPGAFEPVSPDEIGQEQLPAAPLVFAAYAFVWFALLSYVIVLWRRLTQLQRDVGDLSARLSGRRP